MLTRLFFGGLFILICIAGYKLYDLGSLYRSVRDVPAQMTIGPQDADLVVVEFFDYECSFCRDIYPTVLEAVKRDGNVRLVLRAVTHKDQKADIKTLLSFAALQQGKYLETHETLIRKREKTLDQKEIKELAESLGLDYDRLLADMQGDEVRRIVQENFDLAVELKIALVPTFMIGNIVYVPSEKKPKPEDFLKLFAEARGNGAS